MDRIEIEKYIASKLNKAEKIALCSMNYKELLQKLEKKMKAT